ncbi:MAG: hypothetical protein GY780_16775 [bacterium]|nr:hypothetical protein [bacterium]
MMSFFEMPFLQTMPWLDSSGPASDTVIGTWGRLARNLSAFEFPENASVETRKSIAGQFIDVFKNQSADDNGWIFDLDHSEPIVLKLLKEKSYIPVSNPKPDSGRLLCLEKDKHRRILVNFEDHLQFGVCHSGFQPLEVLAQLQDLENSFDQNMEFAFRDDLGFLTANPLNAGTGLKISIMVHLPGLVMTDEIDKILNALRQLRFGVRGPFGSGTAVRGAVFVISNLISLGRDESEIASDFEFHLGKVLRHERTARQQLFASDSLGLEDLSHRSLAVLKNSRLMTSQEAIDRLSHLRLGMGLDMLPHLEYALLNEAMILGQPSHLELIAGHDLTVQEMTEARASLLRNLFNSC